MSFFTEVKQALMQRLKKYKFIIGYVYDYGQENVPITTSNSDGSTNIKIENHQEIHYQIANETKKHLNGNSFKVVDQNITALINSYVLLSFKKNNVAGENKPSTYTFLNNRFEKPKCLNTLLEYAPVLFFIMFSLVFYISLPSGNLPKVHLDNSLQNTSYIFKLLPFLIYVLTVLFLAFNLFSKNKDIISTTALYLSGFALLSFLGTNFISQSIFSYIFIIATVILSAFYIIVIYISQRLLIKRNNTIRFGIETILDQNQHQDIQNIMTYIQNFINEQFNKEDSDNED